MSSGPIDNHHSSDPSRHTPLVMGAFGELALSYEHIQPAPDGQSRERTAGPSRGQLLLT
jgi:hypothetical protein